MAYIEWTDSLSVGVKKFDDQHKVLVSIINDLHQSLSEGKTNDVMSQILERLLDYTIEHFAEEEKYFVKYGYPETADHKEKHTRLIDEVVQLRKQLDEGDITISYETMGFLQDWLIHHVLQADMKYKDFFHSKNVD